ncbi:MAG: nucleotidyltransferase family protein [Candidatus Omnitrophica bacterium]|nr:nucleotidyltransferase family protein [Candidatus Omnitrophota bacterium]
MKALILAAGYATRLYPLTKDFPKPLLKVGSKPIINFVVEKIERLKEVDEIIVVTNRKFISYFKRWAKGLKTRKKLAVVDDLTKSLTDRRGAVGDMCFVVEKRNIKDDLLVVGGDNLFDYDLRGFISFAQVNKMNPAIGAYDIKDLRKAGHYGVVKVNKKMKVIDFQEKPDRPNSTCVAMCLYYFPKNSISLIKEYAKGGNHRFDATGSYIDWLRKRLPVYAYIFEGKWFDIGSIRFYNEAKKRF